MPGKKWSEKEIERLKEFYQNNEGQVGELAQELGRSKNAITKKKQRLGLSDLNAWKKEELEFIKENYSKMSNKQMAQEIDRSQDAIAHKLKDLGLSRSKEELSKILKNADTANFGSEHPRWIGGCPKVICEVCGQEFQGSHGNPNKFCSYECMGKWLSEHKRGKNHHNWSENTAKQRERLLQEYKEWRLQVFERDDYTCQECGQRGGNLEAHHIKSFAEHPELRTELSNGKTLCASCHRKIHGKEKGHINR